MMIIVIITLFMIIIVVAIENIIVIMIIVVAVKIAKDGCDDVEMGSTFFWEGLPYHYIVIR